MRVRARVVAAALAPWLTLVAAVAIGSGKRWWLN